MVNINRFIFLTIVALSTLFGQSSLDKEIKQEGDNIAMLSANAVYHLDDLQLPSILKPFLKKNKYIKALYITENLEGEILVNFYRGSEGDMVFNKKIPVELKKLSYHESNISYDNNMIGKVVIYYSDILDFTKAEKEWLLKKQKIKYIYNPYMEPFEWKNELDKHAGMVADILKLISKKSGIEFEQVETSSYMDGIKLLNEQKADMISGAFLGELGQNIYTTTANSIFSIPAVAVERGDSKNIYLNDSFDLKDKKVAIENKGMIGNYLKKKFPSIKLVKVEDIKEGFDLLRSKKVDLFVLNSVTAQYYIKRKGYEDLKVYKKFDHIFELKPFFRKDVPKELVSIVNKVLLNISEEKINDIFRKWTTVHIKKEIDWDIIVDVIIVSILLILFFLYWNRRLQVRVEEKTSELKKLNENLEETVRQEVKKNQEIQEHLFRSEKLASMGEMIGNIAHQWRQPLSIISTAATGIKLQKDLNVLDDEKLYASCDTINENAQYLSKTIDDFRNFIKGERKREIFLLSEALNSCLYLIDSTIKSNHIKVIYDLDDSIEIDSSKNELVQSLLNILNNAKDALKDVDEDERFIFIKTFENEGMINIVIKDNAGGINEDIKKKIFEPYFTTKHQSQGTGLGLHMVYNIIVEALEGDIVAGNEDFEHNFKHYRGAKFTIILKGKS